MRLRARPRSMSALGSRCALAFTPDPQTVDIFLIDLLPPGKNEGFIARDDEDVFAHYFYPPDAMEGVETTGNSNAEPTASGST